MHRPAGAPILKSINLTIQPGEVFGIDGASGSGKSTLLKSVIGLASIQSGSIRIDSLSTVGIDPETVRSRIITVPQEPFYPPNATLRSALIGSLTPYSLRAMVVTDEFILSLLAEIQLLADLKERAAIRNPTDTHMTSSDSSSACLACPLSDFNLSQKEYKLLSIGRACLQVEVTGAKIVLFDEPTVGRESSGDLDRVFARIVREKLKGCTVIVVSHDVTTLGVADRIVRLERGHLVIG